MHNMFYTNVTRMGNNILVREVDKNGYRTKRKVPFKPSLYLRCDISKKTHTDFYGGSVAEHVFSDIKDMADFVKNYKDMPDYIWGNTKSEVQFIYNEYGHITDYDESKIRIAFIDIEVLTRQKINGEYVDGGFPKASEASFPINAICHYDSFTKKYYLFGLNCEWKQSESCFPDIAKNTVYKNCATEEELLTSWTELWCNHSPDILTGWNTDTFDIPYIMNRCIKLFGESYIKKFSPWGITKPVELKSQFGDPDPSYCIMGVANLDYLALYKKHTFKNRESYTLDHISKCELGASEHKKEFTGTHGEFYWNDPQGFYDYNLKDVNLIVQMDNKLQLFNLVESLAYYAGINYVDTFSPIYTWDSIVYRHCMDNNIAVPMDKKSERAEYPGAWVFDTKVGMHKAIASFDFASLYPSINRSFNIGPDTAVTGVRRDKIILKLKSACIKNDNKELADYIDSDNLMGDYVLNSDGNIPEYITEILKEEKVTMSANWQLYRVDKESVFTYLQTDLYNGRKADKKKMQEYAHKAQEVAQELERRGIKIDVH